MPATNVVTSTLSARLCDDVVVEDAAGQQDGVVLVDNNDRNSDTVRQYRCSKCGQPKKGHVCPYQPQLAVKKSASTQFYRQKKTEGKQHVCCLVCDKTLAIYAKNNLRVHLMGHLPENELPFVCTHEKCDRRFAQKQNMLNHAKKCTGTSQIYNRPIPTEEEAQLARSHLAKLDEKKTKTTDK